MMQIQFKKNILLGIAFFCVSFCRRLLFSTGRSNSKETAQQDSGQLAAISRLVQTSNASCFGLAKLGMHKAWDLLGLHDQVEKESGAEPSWRSLLLHSCRS